MKHRMYRSYILRLVALLLTVTVLLSDFTGFSFANPDEEVVIENEETIEIESGESIVAESESLEEEGDKSAETESLSTEEETVIMESDEESQAVDLTQDMSGSDALGEVLAMSKELETVEELSLYEKIMQAPTVEEMYLLLLEDTSTSASLTVEELTNLYRRAGELQTEAPAKDYEDLCETLQYLAGEFVLEDTMLLADEDKNVYNSDDKKVIYFDISLGEGPIEFTNSTYTGYVNVYTDDGKGNLTGPITKKVTGPYHDDYIYYVFQSSTVADAPAKTKGYVIQDTFGNVSDVKLPEYDEMVCGSDETWAKHVTDKTNIEQMITDWDLTARNVAKKAPTKNYINVKITGKQSTMSDTDKYGSVCNLVLDNVWSSYQTGSAGGLNITGGCYTKTVQTEGFDVTVDLKGNNRLGRILYYTGSTSASSVGYFDLDSTDYATKRALCSPCTLTLTSLSGSGTLTVIGDQKYYKTNGNYTDGKVPYNNWDSVIGGTDGNDHVTGLYITGGTIYAGSTPMENCTVIGGGGNGIGEVTISNATVTAVGHTTGTAIGGGIAHTASGGPGVVTIESGKVFAYNFGQPAYWTISATGWGSIPEEERKNACHVPGTAIGGGGSIRQSGSDGRVTIKGGEVYAQSLGGSAIGGGGTCVGSGGRAEVTITGGEVRAKSIADDNYRFNNISNTMLPMDRIFPIAPGVAIGGGTGGISGNGGNATVVISEDDGTTSLTAGSIGGGSTDNSNGNTGYADVTIKKGTVTGQVVMAKPGGTNEQKCKFTMEGGSLGESPADYLYTKPDGGALWIDDPNGEALVIGGSITATQSDRNVVKGGAVYMTGGSFTLNGTDAKITGWDARENGGAIYLGATGSDKGSFILENGEISDNYTDAGFGGAIYLDGGNATINGGLIQNNTAKSGGGAYLNGGELNVSDGSFVMNTAIEDGGGAYVNGGNINMTGGSFLTNTAVKNGGGAYIIGGNFTMNGSSVLIQGNEALDGAGIYLTGGEPYLLNGTINGNRAIEDGGGIFIDKKIVVMDPVADVFITNNQAGHYGAGICIAGTNGEDAGFAVQKAEAGAAKVTITNNNADAVNGTGGGVCINNGYFNLDSDRIILTNNSAANGGGVAVIGGNFNMSASEIKENTASFYGGGVLVDGGNAVLSGGILVDASGNLLNGGVDTGCGYIRNNMAENGGGGIAVRNGNVIMSAGEIVNNTVNNGNGGGLYVESQGSKVQVMVYSGSISGNTAKGGNGGAVAVVGQAGNTDVIEVQIGVNKAHVISGSDFVHFVHDEATSKYYHSKCPVLRDNSSDISGGACYITGSTTTNLKLFCLTEENNKASGDNDVNNIPLSDFMMVAGGSVLISSSSESNYEGVKEDNDNWGKAVINNGVHVTGGTLDLYGNMDNPHFAKRITLDIEQGQGEFDDHRESVEFVKLMYHENFQDPVTKEENSMLSIYQIKHGDTHTISKNLYGHPGYTIEGWYTYPKKETDGGVWYKPEDVYTFYSEKKYDGSATGNVRIGDLTLYAIWEVHGYSIEYHPNTNKEPHLGEMSIQKFNYDEKKALNTNAYKWPGHIFTGWNTKADGSGTAYTDGQEVRMLTNNNGEILPFYAQWEECTHTPVLKGDGTYSVTYKEKVISDYVKEIHKTCDCGYTSVITLTGTDGVYDGTTKYPAKFSVGTPFFTLNAGDLQYSAVKINDESVSLDPELDAENKWTNEIAAETINAGYYTATLKIDKATGNIVTDSGSAIPEEQIFCVSVNYTVHKAVQLAPPQPDFDPVAINGGTDKNHLQVEKVADSVNAIAAEYLMEYYVNSSVSRSAWTDYVPASNSEAVFNADGKLHFKVESNYTNYYIYARYKSTDNYKASPESRSDSFFFYTGNTDIRVRPENGMTGYVTKNVGVNTGVTLTIQPEPGYYISNRPEISNIVMVREVKAGETSDNIDPMIDNQQTNPGESWGPLQKETFQITNIATNSEITIYVKGARPIPTISSSLEAGQVYEAVTGDAAVISNDSAYTVAYTVTGYDKKDYEAPAIVFDRNLPAGTNLIMKDMDHNTYWYYDTGSAEIAAESPLPVTSFYKMGSNKIQRYTINTPDDTINTYRDLHLQFVVDFSEETITAGDISSTLQIKKLEASPGVAVSNAPDLTDSVKYPKIQAKAHTEVNTFSLHVTQSTVNELEATLTHQYYGAGYASKWDHRQEVLVLTAKSPLPQDAVLYVNVKGIWSYIDRVTEKKTDGNGTEEVVKFIVPLGDPEAEVNDVIVRLQSNMFPKQTTGFAMVAQLGMAQSIAEDAGCNAELQGTPVGISFTNTAFEPAVKVYWDGRGDATGTTGPTSTPEQRVFENGDCMRLMVDYKELPEGNLYEIKTAVLQGTKDKATGELVYLDTAVHPELQYDSDYNINNDKYIKASCKVTFNNYAPGNYCMMVTVTRGGYAILEAPYYFIIKESETVNPDGGDDSGAIAGPETGEVTEGTN